MKILFLDIDGVLNSAQGYEYLWQNLGVSKGNQENYCKQYDNCKQHYISKGIDSGEAHDIALAREWDPICVSNLKKLLREVPDLKIVLSSSWRLGYEEGTDCSVIFTEHPEIKERIIDRTIKIIKENSQRGEEIMEWLSRHPEVESFVVFDDDNDMDAVRSNFIRQDSNIGLTINNVTDAARILNKSPERRPNYFAATCRSCIHYKKLNDSDKCLVGNCQMAFHLLQAVKNLDTGERIDFTIGKNYALEVMEDFKCPMYDPVPWRGSNESSLP